MVTILSHISFGIGEFFSTTFLILFILSFCLFLYMLSKNKRYKKYKYTIVSLSIILVIHLVVFPFIYILMLKNNPACFEFKTSIHSNLKKVVLNEWIDESQSIPREIKELENIKISSNIVLNKSLKELKRLTFKKLYNAYRR
ncbi:cytochrome c biogenesis factor [Chryseobacterium sp. SORGH_AS 447]|nr:cytochrome c biogenesis factor [Chryseobacterium sp. SORGH_AS_0447]